MKIPVVHTSIVREAIGWEIVHDHPTFEISIVLEGRGVFECEGIIYPIASGHVVMIPGGLPHTYRAHTEIRFGVLHAEAGRQETIELFQRLTPGGNPVLLLLSPIALEQYEDLFRHWLHLVSQPLPLQEEAMFLSTWLDLLMLFLMQQRTNNTPSLNASIAATADYIRAHLRSDMSMGELAVQCGLSESAYRTLFKETYGVSPKQYQQACRNAEAKWLLRSTDRAVQHIAEQIGFSTVHSFSAWFHKMEGVYPSDWRKRQQGKP